MANPRIAIVGGGPAGCMLARLLAVNNISVTLFEADTSPNFRNQGGTLDLHPQTGIKAIKAAGLYDAFLKHARFESSSLRIMDKGEKTYISLPASKSGNPEIDRKQLRQLLLEGVGEENIRWGKKLKLLDKNLTLHFSDGSTETGFDLIIGADSAWSKVRNYLSDEKPFYSGISGWKLDIPDAPTAAPEAYKFVNRGNVLAFSNGKALIAQQLGDESIEVSAYIRQAPEVATNLAGKNHQHDLASSQEKVNRPITQIGSGHKTVEDCSKEDILELFKDWSPKLRHIAESTHSVASRHLYMLPVGFHWKHKPGVTLLGDAAHLMTPFAGEGVNLALMDSLELAQAITGSTRAGSDTSIDEAIITYEKRMFKRATKAMRMTDGMMKAEFFTEGAPRTSIEKYALERVGYDKPVALYPLLAVGLYSFFFIYKRFV